MRNKKIITLFFVVFLLFLFGSVSAFALGDDYTDEVETTDITDYKYRLWGDIYVKSDWIGYDLICSSGINSNVVGKDAEVAAAKCDVAKDKSIHVYPAWKIMTDVAALSAHGTTTSFTDWTYLFTSPAGEAENAKWKELTPETINATNYDKVKTTGQDMTIKYAMVYLHKMTNGFDLYRNYRYDQLYADRYDQVPESSAGHYLTKYNGAFQASNTVMYYTHVPHVLGTEGLYYYSDPTGNDPNAYSAIAIMEENSGSPVPVVITKNSSLTGFASIFLKGVQQVEILKENEQLKWLYPYGGNNKDIYTDLSVVKSHSNGDVNTYGDYQAFIVPILKEGAIKGQQIDTLSGLQTAIKAMGGPQYVGSIEIAMSEAITQRYSAYAFMMTLGETGGDFNIGNTPEQDIGDNFYPEKRKGDFNITPRPSYYYVNGSNRENSFNPIQINMLSTEKASWNTNSTSLALSGASLSAEPNHLNKNFKCTFNTYTRDGCFNDYDESTCSRRVKFNYFNDVEAVKITGPDDTYPSYWAYKIVPKTAYYNNPASTGRAGQLYTLSNNNGFSTFYYSNAGTNDMSAPQEDADWNVYSNARNAWGTYRQSGYTVTGSPYGGDFARDVADFPLTPFGDTDFSKTNRLCRFPVIKGFSKHNRYFGVKSELNDKYYETYLNIFNNNGRNGITVDDSFDEMTDIFMINLKTTPEIIINVFRYAQTVINGTYAIDGSCRPTGTTGYERYMHFASADELRNIYNEAANSICEKFGTTCTSENFADAMYSLRNSPSPYDLTHKYFTTYQVLVDALNETSENAHGLKYGEHLGFVFYNYYSLVSKPDEYTSGSLFAARNNARNYSFSTILMGDKSNIMLLNEEGRFGSMLTGEIDTNGMASGTALESATGPLGEHYGPEISLVSAVDGGVYVPGVDEEDLKCPIGYTKEGTVCTRENIKAVNKACNPGYSFDINTFECVEQSEGITYCPTGFQLVDKKCVNYNTTSPICNDGEWDTESKTCVNKEEPKCPAGYTLKDIGYDTKIIAKNTYTFASGNGDVGKFSGSKVSNIKQEGTSALSYNITGAGGYIEVKNINLDASDITMLQFTIKNDTAGTLGRVSFTTNESTYYDSIKEETFTMYPDRSREYITYTVDMSGGRWKGTITNLKFAIDGATSGKVTIDNIVFGTAQKDYRRNLMCVKEWAPTCPEGFFYEDGRCYGYGDDLPKIPDTYELVCDYVPHGDKEEVSLVNFNVGDSLDIALDTANKTFTVPINGNFYIEVWGASNGTAHGGYSAGMVELKEGDTLHLRNGVQNNNTSTVIAKNGKKQSDVILSALAGSAGVNKTSTYKLTKTGTDWFKRVDETANTTWTGERGHVGNGHIRITFYGYKNLISSITQKNLNITAIPSGNLVFGYTGAEQTYTATEGVDYDYIVEAWGAQGGNSLGSTTTTGGKGGYAKGTIELSKDEMISIFVGGKGEDGVVNGTPAGGYNGGGNGKNAGAGGGGMTSIKSGSEYLLVAGGGGGGGMGQEYEVQILNDKQSTKDDMPGTYDTYSITQKVKAGDIVEMYMARYSTRASSTVPYYIRYSANAIPSSETSSNSWQTYLEKYELIKHDNISLSSLPTWDYSQNTTNMTLITSFKAPKDGYYFIYTDARQGRSSRHDSVSGTRTYQVNAYTDESGIAGAGGGITGGNSVIGKVYDYASGIGGTSSKYYKIGVGEDSTSIGGNYGGAGGGGYYGGFSAKGYVGGGGGGSGYIGKVKDGALTSNQRSGNGYVRITRKAQTINLGYLITAPKNNKVLGSCYVHAIGDSVDLSQGLGVYLNTYQIPKCDVRNSAGTGTTWDSSFGSNFGQDKGTTVDNRQVLDFNYTGKVQTATLTPGKYILETWGAEGGGRNLSKNSNSGLGGKGGYSVGTITIDKNTNIYVYVGGHGLSSTSGNAAGGFNGGGQGYASGSSEPGNGGGGASDIRINTDSLYNRVIVAGGGGGGGEDPSDSYGHGGGTSGVNGAGSTYNGTQTAAGSNGSFGLGAGTNKGDGGGGGGGWYGGGTAQTSSVGGDTQGGGGGSGYVLTSSSSKPSGYALGSKYYLTDAKTIAGNTSMPSIDGKTENGHTGDGYVRITPVKDTSSGSNTSAGSGSFTPIIKDRCTNKVRFKIMPPCDEVAGGEFDVKKEVCKHERDVLCNGGVYNAESAKCEYKRKPSGCTNGGILTGDMNNGFRCHREASAFCDIGYHLEDGTCIKDTIKRYKNGLCSEPYHFDEARKVCVGKSVIDLNKTSGTTLRGDLNVIEVGKIYKYSNYAAYRSSAEKAKKDIFYDGINPPEGKTSSSVFPAIDITFTLIQSGEQEIGSTEYCRTRKNDEKCKTLENVNRYEIDLKNVNKNETLYIGDKEVMGSDINQFHSQNPAYESNLSDKLWSEYRGQDARKMFDSDFGYLWSDIDIYFMFKEDAFCYLNSTPNNFNADDMQCIPYTPKAGFTVNKNIDGKEVVALDMTKDENGKTLTNTIYIRTQVGTPTDYVDSDLAALRDSINLQQVAYTGLLNDNMFFKDDTSDFVTEFKLAPDGDVFIDRFEVVRADTNEVVFAADAMTKDRCSNGYAIETGSTARYTQTYSNQAYDGGSVANPGTCTPFDPTTILTVLDPTVNYYTRTYTKYVSLNEQNIAVGTPASQYHIALDIVHLSNDSSSGAFNEYIPTMRNAALSDKYILRSSNTDNGTTAKDILHNTVIKFDATNGLVKKVNKKNIQVVNTGIDSINKFFRKNKDIAGTAFSTAPVAEPLSATLIPAEGLFAKGKVNGLYNVTVSGESSQINAYATWDYFPFNYYLGEGPDIETTIVLRCDNGEYKERENACVIVPQGFINCKLYVIVENIGNTQHDITSNVRVDVNNRPGFVNASNGTIYRPARDEDNILNAATPRREIFIRNVNSNIYVGAIHNSTDNGKYADINWKNNEDESCFLFNYVNYGISNLSTIDKIWVDTDCNNNPVNTTTNVQFNATFNIDKDYDSSASRNIGIAYRLQNGANGTKSGCTFTPVSTVVSGGNGTSTTVDYTANCSLAITKADIRRGNIELTIKINGGKTGAHVFEESTYDDNEVVATIAIGGRPKAGLNCFPNCDATCTQQNTWNINFDYIYTFDRGKPVNYETPYEVNMSWTDYDVGKISGETENKEYSAPIGSGNIYRAPDDYMAFKSDKITKEDLCTDYRAGNAECWRYEQNVAHNVTYYLWSKATTSVYTTHKTLTSDNAGRCTPTTAKFNGGETYGSRNHGASGSSYKYADGNDSDRKSTVCHGFTQAPESTACRSITDWWGNLICDEYTEVYSANADTGNHPSDYIPYKNFQDYTLRDGYSMSPTTKTDQIILSNQKQTNKDQGSAHTGWAVERKMNVCTSKAPMDVGYSCPTNFTYGTKDGRYYYHKTTGDEGMGICPDAKHGATTRECEWKDRSNTPPDEEWWNTTPATCYRLHRDYVCDRYYRFSNVNNTVHNSGNETSGTCNWKETVNPVITRSTGTDHAYGQNSCSSTCRSWNHDKYGNKTSCRSYTSGTCVARGSSGCASCRKTCHYGGGSGCSVSCSGSATHYYATAKWTASDGQTTSSSKDGCSAPSFSSHTFTHSETYDGSGRGNNMHYSCSSGDLDTGGYCYETRDDGSSLTTGDERCVRWTEKTYKDIKYYSTDSGDSSRIGWVSRTYKDLSNIWQYTCNTKTPSVPYPTDTNQLMTYKESVTSSTQMKTARSGNWVTLDANGNTPESVMPRRGEWFELRFIVVYSTTRGTSPFADNLLTNYYNNYHNIEGSKYANQENTTIYPSGGYQHYGVTDSGHTEFGDGKTVKNKNMSDIVNNPDYGYCNARPAEPYGCSYRTDDPVNQFNYTGKNFAHTNQGHIGAEWTSNQEGNGTCYYGPDNKTVWKKFEFGNDYYNTVLICTDGENGKCKADTALATYVLGETGSYCNRMKDGLCVEWIKIFEIPAKTVNGQTKRGMYLPGDWDMSKQITIDMRTSHFKAVGQYEKELLGNKTLSSGGAETFFMEQAGAPIKELCACQSTKLPVVNNPNFGWGSSEWEVD